MKRPEHPGEVEDFTGPFLVTFGVIVFVILVTIHIVLGFLWALMCAYGADKAMARWSRQKKF